MNQGMIDFNPDDASLTKPFGKEGVLVEDLMFRKITAEKLNEF